MKRKTKRIISLIVAMVMLVTSVAVYNMVKTDAADYEVTYVSSQISMNGYNVHSFKVNGYEAYCVEFNDGSPVEGDTFTNVSTVTDPSSMLYKTLYYGWGGPGYDTFKNSVGSVSDNWGVVQTTVIASHYYSGQPASVSGFELYQYINDASTPLPPARTVSFSPSSVTAVTMNGQQETGMITLNADSRISLSITLDSDVTLYFSGDSTPHTGTVTIKGGQKFYLTAPTTKNGTTTMTASGGGDQLFTVNVMSITTSGKSDDNYQKLAVAIPSPVTASFSATFQAYGGIEIYKTSSNPEVSNGSDCYSLQGAVYGVYGTQADAGNKTNPVTTITTDATGYGKASNLPVQTYYVREITAPKGYALDNTIHTVAVNANVNTRMDVTDVPQMDPVAVLLTKQGDDGTLLAGAEFEIKFYKGITQTTDPALDGKSADKTWVIKTGDDGVGRLNESCKVSGDEFYYTSLGDVALPLGTLTIQESKAPEGYVLDDTVFVRTITADGSSENVQTYNAPVLTNDAKTGIVQIKKTGENRVYNETTGEFEITEVNLSGIQFGIFSGDNLVETITTDANGNAASGELALGTYTIKELNTPKDLYPMEDITVEFKAEDELVDVNGEQVIVKSYEVLNKVRIPSLGTTATDNITGTHIGSSSKEAEIKDVVECTGLIVGEEYTIPGKLVLLSSGKPLLIDGKEVTAEKTFVATEEDMEVELIYKFDASALQGETVVCFEYLYREDILVATHADLNDKDQSVFYPGVKTTAKDSVTGTNIGTVGSSITIIDTVALTNLIVGEKYTLVGEAYDPETGEAFMVDGKPLTSSVDFKASSANCSVDVPFTFDSSLLHGKKLVFFETLYVNGVKVAVHEDLTDEGQTITFPPAPPEEVPPTGDSMPVIPMVIMLVVSLAGIGLLLKKKIFS